MTTTLATARRHSPTRAIGTLVEAAAVIAGFPVLLIKGVGWPLPQTIPTWTDIHRAYQIRYIPDRLVLGTLACAGWICWATMVVSLVVGLIARVRSTDYRRQIGRAHV